MKCTIPEISWHNRDPVLSIDLKPGVNKTSDGKIFWRLATGGADSHVLIWHLTVNEVGATVVEFVGDLSRHQKAVNVVRFSPSGEILASGDDESAIMLWKERGEFEPPPLAGDDTNQNKEQWNLWKILRGHVEDVYDLSWSPDSNFLVSGSVDNTAILWDVEKGRSMGILSDHKGFVQGVSWDPSNQYVCTLSTDRQCRLFDINTKKTVQRVSKAKIPTPANHPLKDKTVRLFYDDTFQSFFRRLTFSPDGLLIIAPSGIIEPQESSEKLSNATIIFSRHNIKEPIVVLPSLEQFTVAVRCCPIYFKLREDGPVSMIGIPYRIVFAVATKSSVLIYDTQQVSPIAIISNIHYTRLTDIAWSSDGRLLVVSSTDGYCSIIHFQDGELGNVYESSLVNINDTTETKSVHSNSSKSKRKTNNAEKTEFIIDMCSDAMDIDITKPVKASDFSEEANNGNKDDKLVKNVQNTKSTDVDNVVLEETEDIKLVYTEESNTENISDIVKKTPPKPIVPNVIAAKTPRRVQLITLSSPRSGKKN
ncbi:chromatin assembly factor 1 subunit B [Neodiprion virginianus]|uniref:chromatin assembly factor 1 subunit B n=1 Tax=Neodiprion virginianus TaxID=2961670 RepID=UPI001EE6A17A|nr:chromatin assembly factor 1 subunit B [Neodiprion virginianus]